MTNLGISATFVTTGGNSFASRARLLNIDHGVFHPDALPGAFTDDIKPLDL